MTSQYSSTLKENTPKGVHTSTKVENVISSIHNVREVDRRRYLEAFICIWFLKKCGATCSETHWAPGGPRQKISSGNNDAGWDASDFVVSLSWKSPISVLYRVEYLNTPPVLMQTWAVDTWRRLFWHLTVGDGYEMTVNDHKTKYKQEILQMVTESLKLLALRLY